MSLLGDKQISESFVCGNVYVYIFRSMDVYILAVGAEVSYLPP